MMEGKISLIIKTIFALIVLFLLFPITAHGAIPRDPNLPPDIADSDYYWGSPTTITNIEKGVNFTYHDKGAPDTGWALNTTLYNFYLIKEDNQFKLNGLAVAVLKTNPRSGYFKDKDNPELAIAIKDPFNVAPQPLRSITKGYLWGQIFPINIDQWKSKPEEVIKDGSVDLIYFDPTAGYWVQVTGFATADYRGVDIENKNYVFRLFTVSQANGGKGLLEGRYRLVYSHSEKASRTTGDAKGDFTQWLIGVESLINGEIEFQLDRINDYDAKRDNANLIGYGKLTYINPGADHEAKSPASSTYINSANRGIYIDVVENTVGATFDDVFENAFKNALLFAGNGIALGMQTVSKWIDQSIKESADIDTPVLQNTAKNVRNISLSLLTLGLLIIAFANILNLQVDQFGLPRILPKFVIGIVLAYFSYFIAMFLLSFMGALQSLMISSMGQSGLNGLELGVVKLFGIEDTGTGYTQNILASMLNNGSLVAQALLMIIIMIMFFLVFIWLWLVMIVRKAMLMLLVVVAPLAFIASILPWTETYYKKWWATFWKWAFIGPAVIFMLLLAKLFLEAWYGETFSAVMTNIDPARADTWIYLIIYGVLIFMAGAVPLKMGSEIYGKIGVDKLPGKARKWVWGKTGVPDYMAGRKAQVDARTRRKADLIRAQMAAGGAPGFITGVKTDAERGAAIEKLVTTIGAEGGYKNLEEAKLKSLLSSTNEYEAMAAATELADRKRLSANIDNENASRVNGLMGQYQILSNKVIADNKDVYSALELRGVDTNGLALKTAAKTKPAELSAAQIMLLQRNAPGHIRTQLSNTEIFKSIIKDTDPAARARFGQYLSTNPNESSLIQQSLLQAGMSQEELNQHIDTLERSRDDYEAQNPGKHPLDL